MGPLTIVLILAILQGLTEYLPVSSSGHLVLGRSFLPGGEQLSTSAALEVWLHLGTLFAVLLFYRRQVAALAVGVLGFGPDIRAQRVLFLQLVVATIPAGLVGLLLEDQIATLFADPRYAATALLITGFIVWSTKGAPSDGRSIRRLTWGDAIWMGIAQAFAIIPGISRSGSTIVLGMRRGLAGDAAATFSFLLSIPAILGALVLKLPDIQAEESLTTTELLISLVVSFGVGIAALGLLVWLTRRRRLWVFAPYCWVAGCAALLYSWLA